MNMAHDACLVSAVVTAHNAAHSIAPCLESLTSQAGNMEIILVDDRSSDGTADTARGLGLGNLRVFEIRDYTDKKLTARQKALDLGFRQARGKWVAVLDADGQARPGWIAQAMMVHEETGASAISGPVGFRPAGPSWKARVLAALQTIDSLFYTNWCSLLARLGFASGMLFGNCVFLKDAYTNTGGFAETGFSLTEDLAFARLLHKKGKRIAYAKAPMVSVQACATVSGLLCRAERISVGAPSFLAVFIGLWMMLLLILALLSVYGGSLALSLLAARYLCGVAWLGWSMKASGLFSLFPLAFVYEPMAIVMGMAVWVRTRRKNFVDWGGVRYAR